MQQDEVGGLGREEQKKGPLAPQPQSNGAFSATVNTTQVLFPEPTVRGEAILHGAGLKPVSDHVLIQLLGHSSRSIELDENVDLLSQDGATFRAFKNDRIFRFTLNGHGFDWGAGTIVESELRQVARVREDEVIVLERDDADIVLEPGSTLDLARPGTEHLYSEKRLITVFFENKPREIKRGVYTTEELIKLFGVQQGYILEVINQEGHLTPLKPGEKLKVKEGMHFFEQVPCGGSS